MDRIMVFAISFSIALSSCVAYLIFVMLPVQLDAQAKCLALGFPNSKTTFSLETYCTNLNESVPLSGAKK